MTDRVSRYSVKVSDTTIGEILMIDNEPVARKEIISSLSEEEFHGSAGVYYHITNREGPPLVYAGKAYHLGRRAMKKSRIESVSQIVLISLTGPRNGFGLMDENWRQQLEHLMIRDLLMRDFNDKIESENKSVESQSLCHAGEKKEIEIFFDTIIKKLGQLCPTVFGGRSAPRLFSSIPDTMELKIPDKEGSLWVKDSSMCAVVSKDVIAEPTQSDSPGINLSHQREKASLIERGILEEVKDGLKFTKPHLFTTKTEAAAILLNKNQFRKSAWKLK